MALSEREGEVLALAARGMTNREIAACLCIAKRTVDEHLFHIYCKLGVANRVAAMAKVFGFATLQSVGSESD